MNQFVNPFVGLPIGAYQQFGDFEIKVIPRSGYPNGRTRVMLRFCGIEAICDIEDAALHAQPAPRDYVVTQLMAAQQTLREAVENIAEKAADDGKFVEEEDYS